MAEMNSTLAAGTAVKKWEFNATRNKGGVHTCLLTDPDGNEVIESVHDCAAASDSRAWVNPPDEIAHIRVFSEFLKAHKQPQRDTVGMDMVPPYSVYVDGEAVAVFDTEREASELFNELSGHA